MEKNKTNVEQGDNNENWLPQQVCWKMDPLMGFFLSLEKQCLYTRMTLAVLPLFPGLRKICLDSFVSGILEIFSPCIICSFPCEKGSRWNSLLSFSPVKGFPFFFRVVDECLFSGWPKIQWWGNVECLFRTSFVPFPLTSVLIYIAFPFSHFLRESFFPKTADSKWLLSRRVIPWICIILDAD